MIETISLPIPTLNRWRSMLDDETKDLPISQMNSHPSAIIAEEMYDVLLSAEKSVKAEKAELEKKRDMFKEAPGLTMKDIEVQTIYKFKPMTGNNDGMSGKRVEVIQKKRTNIVATLLDDSKKYKAGTRLSLKPIMLENL